MSANQIEVLEKKLAQLKAKQEQSAGFINFPFVYETDRGRTNIDIRVANTKALLDHYSAKVRYNEMSKDIDVEVTDKTFSRDTAANAKLVELHDRCKHHGYRIGIEELGRHLILIANENTFHPVRDWILETKWDGKSRLEDLCNTVEIDETVSRRDVANRFIRMWLIQAIAAVFEPRGISTQGVLVFVGKQGLGKTTWIKNLVGNPDWVREGVSLNAGDKDSVLLTVSRWIVELGELGSTFRKSDIDALKAFITRNEDTLRPAYAPKADTYARRTVLYGSVDDSKFLVDRENRRFWTVAVNRVNPYHGIDVAQLWAEVYELYKAGEQYIPSRTDIEILQHNNESFKVHSPIADLLSRLVRKPIDTPDVADDKVAILHKFQEVEKLNATWILIRCGIAKPKRDEVREAANWLTEQGFRHVQDGNSKLFTVVFDKQALFDATIVVKASTRGEEA